MSVATDASEAEFAEFIDEYGLHDMHHLTDLERPALVAAMLADHEISGVPGFVAIRPGGDYATYTGWRPLVATRLANFLDP